MKKKVRLKLPSRDLSWMLKYESTCAAGVRLGLDEEKVRELMDKGILVYAYSPKHKMRVLVGDGFKEVEKGKKRHCWESGIFGKIKGVLRIFFCGPETHVEVVVWSLLMPVSVPLLFVSKLVTCWFKAFAHLNDKGNYFPCDYEGVGLFDEVSTARREDIQFLLGTGPYAKENW